MERPCIPVTHNFSLSEGYELSVTEGHKFICQNMIFCGFILCYYFLIYSTNTPFPDIRISGSDYGYRSSGFNGGCCKTIHFVHKLNWLQLFEDYIKIVKIFNYKDNLMAPIEQSFPKMC